MRGEKKKAHMTERHCYIVGTLFNGYLVHHILVKITMHIIREIYRITGLLYCCWVLV